MALSLNDFREVFEDVDIDDEPVQLPWSYNK